MAIRCLRCFVNMKLSNPTAWFGRFSNKFALRGSQPVVPDMIKLMFKLNTISDISRVSWYNHYV